MEKSQSIITLLFTPSYLYAYVWMKYCGSHYEYVGTLVDDTIYS